MPKKIAYSDTDVSVSRSQERIRQLFYHYDVEAFQFGEDREGNLEIQFRWNGLTIRIPFSVQALVKAMLREEPYSTRRRSTRAEYEELCAEYESLRRPFSVTADVPYTDVWDFPTVQAYAGKHPCEKPLAMMEHIVTASSREGDVVLDCFCGSGATGEAAVKHGREFVGIELSEEWCQRSEGRISELVNSAQQAMEL